MVIYGGVGPEYYISQSVSGYAAYDILGVVTNDLTEVSLDKVDRYKIFFKNSFKGTVWDEDHIDPVPDDSCFPYVWCIYNEENNKFGIKEVHVGDSSSDIAKSQTGNPDEVIRYMMGRMALPVGIAPF